MKRTILTMATALFFVLPSLSANEGKKVYEVNRTSKIVEAFDVSKLCKAIMNGDIDKVKKMIEFGEDINKKSLGKTPAHYAARYNQPEILDLLIENGADLDKRCDQGFTVIKYAELSKAMDALKVLHKSRK